VRDERRIFCHAIGEEEMVSRRNILKGGLTGLLSMIITTEVVGKSKNIIEMRTREYLNNIPEWDERSILGNIDDEHHKEFLFTGGCDRKEMLDSLEQEGFALVYSPRHIVQKGHFFDLIKIKIGDKNITRIQELFKEEGNRDKSGNFVRLLDI